MINLQWLRRKRARHPLVQQFESVRPPPGRSKVYECQFLAVDLELTSLDPRTAQIVSMGWVPIRQGEVILTEAQHQLIKTPLGVGQSAAIHGLHDRDLEHARPLHEVLVQLLSLYAGYVFVAHHAALDKGALSNALRRWLGCAPKFTFIDTLQIERNRLARSGQEQTHGELRLPQCLARHNLPAGAQHHALEDAYGCALLLLSQISAAGGNRVTLADLQRLSR